jgi:hypothetical protein
MSMDPPKKLYLKVEAADQTYGERHVTWQERHDRNDGETPIDQFQRRDSNS